MDNDRDPIALALDNLCDALVAHDEALAHLEAITPFHKGEDIPVRAMLNHPLYKAIRARTTTEQNLARRRAELDNLLREW